MCARARARARACIYERFLAPILPSSCFVFHLLFARLSRLTSPFPYLYKSQTIDAGGGKVGVSNTKESEILDVEGRDDLLQDLGGE